MFAFSSHQDEQLRISEQNNNYGFTQIYLSSNLMHMSAQKLAISSWILGLQSLCHDLGILQFSRFPREI